MANTASSAFAPGTVLVGLTDGSGQIDEYSASGSYQGQLTDGSGTTNDTGMCFDAQQNLYATNFERNTVSKFSPTGQLASSAWASGFNADPESCATSAAGNVFVGEADGEGAVTELDSSGTVVKKFYPEREDRGTDWVDLASDQCTLFYTSEGDTIGRYDVCTDKQLTPFATGLDGPCYAFRIMADGEVLVACASEVERIASTGSITQRYPAPNNDYLFALNIDPSETAFWTAGIFSGRVYKIDLTSGKVSVTFKAQGGAGVVGLAVAGEPTALQPNGLPIPSLPGNSGPPSNPFVLGMGDSVAAGYGLGPSDGFPDNGNAYPYQLGQALNASITYDVAQAGDDSNTVLNQQVPWAGWLKPDIVTLTVGADDIDFKDCYQAEMRSAPDPCMGPDLQGELTTLENHLTQIFTTIKNSDSHIREIFVTHYYNPFPSLGFTPCTMMASPALYSLWNDWNSQPTLVKAADELAYWTNASTFFTADMYRAQDRIFSDAQTIIGALNGAIDAEAGQFPNLVFPVTLPDFAQHDMCSSQPYSFEPSVFAAIGSHAWNTAPAVCPGPAFQDPAEPSFDKTVGGTQIQAGITVNCSPHPTVAGQQYIAGQIPGSAVLQGLGF